MAPYNVTRLQASDEDGESNGLLFFSFEGFELTQPPFGINSDTGQVFLLAGLEGMLDREIRDSYEVMYL